MESKEGKVARIRLAAIRTEMNKMRMEESRISKALQKARNNPGSEKVQKKLSAVASKIPVYTERKRAINAAGSGGKVASKFGDALFLKLEEPERKVTVAYRLIPVATEKSASASGIRGLRIQYAMVIWKQGEDVYKYTVQRAIAFSKLQGEALEIKYALKEGQVR